MVKAQQNIKVINKSNSDFPDYLDFEKLRREGIEYLGKLSGKIWTDHNVHDPGITILEVLCYSLLDLGYRTNLPAADIFTDDPANTEKDDNFFTPAQILACNPLTIVDYRKLLIDIDGVKNAWLEVATDQTDFCKPQPDPLNRRVVVNNCDEFLNGLYHVYIDPEKNTDSDFKNEADAKQYLNDLYNKVKEALMHRRNFCEDFVDIYMLCKLQIGICADIDLKVGADAEKTYISIAQNLREFFSPSPKFYTLQQLLDKNKPIDEIFAGRPYDLLQSHGFIDTDELLQLKLKKEIHLSDVYNVILQTEGVQKVNNLGLRNCKGNNLATNSNWKFKLPENYVPDFSMECSGFQFTRNGLPVELDTKKYEGLLKINFSHKNKILYQAPSAFLDNELPKGIYHSNLDEYFLLQEDFPKVYGIAEGGLPQDATNLRNAQALQIKGYLLFFDQLLAGYLSQLKNIRSLFAMSSSGNKDKQHTYFLNKLETLPELNKLFRFAVGADGSNVLGKDESILVSPVSKIELDEMITLNQAKDVDPPTLSAFMFPSLSDQQIAISALKDDFYNGSFTYGFLNENSSCIYYYIISSSNDFALISKKDFKTIAEANLHLNSVAYMATFDENYYTFIKSANSVSFNIGLNISSVKGYLQQIIEDKELYSLRRNSFLDHLLSRFAERFTDFALLSYSKLSSQEASLAGIKAKENFLTNYDDISSNRGRAYNYIENKWKNSNISGFENEVKFLSDIENKELRSLCNFVVDQYDDQYLVDLKIAGQTFFTLDEKFDSPTEAEEAAKSVFTALSDPEKLRTQYIAHEQLYAVQVQYTDRHTVFFNERYESAEEAEQVKDNFNRMFSAEPAEKDVFISSYRYVVQLADNNGEVVRESINSFETEAEAQANGLIIVYKINDNKNWLIKNNTKAKIGALYLNKTSTDPLRLIDVQSFKIDINNSIVGKPDKFTYDMLDSTNFFKFFSEKEFETSKDARQHCWFVISLAADEANYQISKKTANANFKISIVYNNELEATCYSEFSAEQEALDMQQQIISLIKKREFILKTAPVANGWKFNYRLGYKPGSEYPFISIDEYSLYEDAIKAAKVFNKAIPSLQVQSGKQGVVLAPINKDSDIPTVVMGSATDNLKRKSNELVVKALELQSAIVQLANNLQALREAVKIDESSGTDKYVYRLVDKDTILAFYQEKYPDKRRADLGRRKVVRTLRENLKYLQLCLGGDIINQITSGTSNITLYRYQLKAHNKVYSSGNLSGKEIVLFESSAAYASIELAIKAFEENYLYILALAEDESNYGTLISLSELSYPTNSASLVFIPANTITEFNSSGEGPIMQIMATIAKSYPIKQVEYGSQAFNTLFCENIDPVSIDPCKTGTKRKYVYYFATYNNQKDPAKWQSVNYYDTAEKAMQDFIFFVALLKYAGNLYVNCDLCDNNSESIYRIYLREVLAESTDRFANEASAWGKEGVQKFICAVQSNFGFHNYQRNDDCCYTFYLNCGQDIVVHPCVYDTAKKRNKVLNEIFIQFNAAIEKQSYTITEKGNDILLLNEAGSPFARKLINKREGSCETLLDIIEHIRDINSSYTQEGEDLFLKDSSGKVILQSVNKNTDVTQWKNTLKAFAFYYPIIKTLNEQTGKYSYSLELKFPGFNPIIDERDEQPCGCDEKTPDSEPECYLAWKSSCGYATCIEAMQALAHTQKLLADFENYQPVVDCTCNAFGIAILFNQFKTSNDKTSRLPISSRWGNRIAFNPQCYESAQMVCNAVERTKALTNAEGLHVAEHILLRPRCPGDCECRRDLYCGELKRHCNYEWLVSDDDPCNQANDICFIPGSDPYSFVATVALPAWPQRFRTATGRKAMEDILYRLAPAHVMLRILWLAPHDFCCFESKYKGWRRWLAKKKTCNTDFSVCDFLDFLFKRNYECIDDCTTCLPCKNEVVESLPCFNQDIKLVKSNQNRFLNQVNETFCWQVVNCEKYEFLDCDRIIRIEGDRKTSPKAKKKTPIRIKRTETYRNTTNQIAQKLKNSVVVANVQAFLMDDKPTVQHFETVVTGIIQNKKSSKTNSTALNAHQILHLLQNVVGYTLDYFSYEKDKTDDIKLLKGTFEKMHKAKIDMSAIYNHWDGLELKKSLPHIQIDEIKELLTGINNK
jgi:hypothetical protein